jgi:tetratricopeptide (TPR) repeat protein
VSDPATVAVLDFEATGPEPANDYAFGMADLFNLELQRHGVATLERREIRYVISEQQLMASGLVEPTDVIRRALPWVTYLVKGQVSRSENGQFTMAVSLVEARTAHEICSVTAAGEYPKEMAAAVSRLAEQVVSKLAVRGTAPKHAGPEGFATMPETALLYYKGIEHCLAGRPEYGVQYFRAAVQGDSSFVLARVWTMRAYGMLGLPAHEAVAREELLRSPHGAAILAKIRRAAGDKGDRFVVAVAASNCFTPQCQSLLDLFKEGIRAGGRIEVFSPDWINPLAAEADLRLTELFEHRDELTEAQWAWTDAVALFAVGNEPAPAKGTVKIAVLEPLSGQAKLSLSIPAEPLSVLSAVKQVCDSLLSSSQRQRATLSTKHTVEQPSEVTSEALMRMDQIAEWLCLSAGQQPDRDALISLAQHYGHEDWRYAVATWDRLQTAIQTNEADAATWLSTALWGKRWARYCAWPPVAQFTWEEDFAPLLERYPDTLAATMIRYAIAHDLLDAGRHEEAAKILLPLARRPPDGFPHELLPSLYYFAALEALQTGKKAEADEILTKAESIAVKADPYFPAYGYLGLVHKPTGIGWNYFGTIQRRSGDYWIDLHGDIKELRSRLSGQAPTEFPNPAELLSEAYRAEDGARAVQLRIQFLEAVILEKNRDPAAYQRITADQRLLDARVALEWVLKRAQTDEERQRIVRLAEQLADGLSLARQVILQQVVGNRSKAAALIEQEIAQARTPTEAVLLRGELLKNNGGPAAQARYLHSEFVKALSTTGGQSLDILSIGCTAGTALREAHLYADACELYRKLYDLPKLGSELKYSIAYDWADGEVARGDSLQAAELLREIVKQAQGQRWFIHDRPDGGHDQLYDRALERLKQIRLEKDEPLPQLGTTPLASEIDPQAEEAFETMLQSFSGRLKLDHGDPAIQEFIRKYGDKATPVALAGLQHGKYPWEDTISVIVLNQTATSQYAKEIVAAFVDHAELASLAFRLDYKDAATVLRRKVLPVAETNFIHPDLIEAIVKNHVRELYDIVLAYVVRGGTNWHTIIPLLDRELAGQFTEDQEQEFRVAIANYIVRHLEIQNHDELEYISQIGLKHGVPEGITGLLHSDRLSPSQMTAIFRRYMDLPSDEFAAMQLVGTNVGNWRWDAAAGKFVIGARGNAAVNDAAKD